MANYEGPIDNRLLAALTDACGQQWWRRHLERIDLKLGQVLYAPSRPQLYAYFPTSAVVSLLYLMESGASAEIAVVGNEGIVGTSLFLGGASTTSHGSVLIAGQGFRIEAQTVKEEFDRSESVRYLLLRYTQALITQMAQTAVCNRHHAIDQQVCGWLLHSLDRLLGSEVVVTQELISHMLGVRRESITLVVGHLQANGLIRCTRGHIVVLDHAGLERRACECHAVVKKEYDRLLPQVSTAPMGSPAWPLSSAWDKAAPNILKPKHEVAAA
jgi:CRP-like cAMP-binding protein